MRKENPELFPVSQLKGMEVLYHYVDDKLHAETFKCIITDVTFEIFDGAWDQIDFHIHLTPAEPHNMPDDEVEYISAIGVGVDDFSLEI